MATIFSTFQQVAREYSEHQAICFLEDGKVVSWTYGELLEKALAFAGGLNQLGFHKGDRIALISGNGPWWSVVDFGIARQGIVVVPIHTTLAPAQAQKILQQSQVKGLVLGDHIEKLFPALKEILPTTLKCVIGFDETFPQGKNFSFTPFHRLSEVLAMGRMAPPMPAPELSDHDPSTIMYTSGTTGEMKGAVLSQNNLTHNAQEGLRVLGKLPNEVVLSVLPLSHAFERVAGLFGHLFCGNTVAYGQGLNYLLEDMKIFRPHTVDVVPRLLEKIQEAIVGKVQGKSLVLSRLFAWHLKLSAKLNRLRQDRSTLAWLYLLPDQIGHSLFYKKIREQFGGRLSRFLCGGAPLDPRVVEFFFAIGIPVYEGYGLTECSPIVTVNPKGRTKVGTAGVPISGVEVRLGANDEILVRGPNVMLGYDHNPEATAEMIDAEGWLHTGDQGAIDGQGYLAIKGRVKELIVTSYGKNIIPSLVEHAAMQSPFIHQVAVFGHGKAYLSALIVPSFPALQAWAQKQGLATTSPEALCEAGEVCTLMEGELVKYSKGLASHERIKRFKLIPFEFTTDNHLLTLTLKLKRNKIAETYDSALAALYPH